MGRLELREMGQPVVLGAEEYPAWAPAISTLISHKILTMQQSGTTRLIRANQFAGSARCSAGTLVVRPRFPDVVSTLRQALLVNGRSVSSAGYNPSTSRAPGRDAVSAFLDATLALTDQGLPRAYNTLLVESSTLSGVLSISETISRFASSGNHHQAVVRRSQLRADHQLCELISHVLTLLADELLLSDSEAHLLSYLAEPLLEVSAEPLTDPEALARIDVLEVSYEDTPQVLDLLTVARIILEDRELEHDTSYQSDIVSYHFVDTNGLWERAVAHALNQTARPDECCRLHPYQGAATPMFPNGGPNLDPDIGAFQSEHLVAVVDAKNYTAQGPDAAATYQVYSYARTLGQALACLFYLDDGHGWQQSFGDSTVTIKSYGISVTAHRTMADLAMAANDLWSLARRAAAIPSNHGAQLTADRLGE